MTSLIDLQLRNGVFELMNLPLTIDPMLTKNLVVIVTEIIAIAIILTIVNLLVGVLFQPLIKLPALKRWKKNAKQVQQQIHTILGLCRALLCLVVAAVNAWWVFNGVEDLLEHTIELIKSIPPTFWLAVGIGIAKSVFLLCLVRFSLPHFHRLVDLANHHAQNIDKISANDESIDEFFDYLKTNFTTIIWLFAIAICTQFLQLPEIVPKYLYIGGQIYFIVTIGKLLLTSPRSKDAGILKQSRNELLKA